MTNDSEVFKLLLQKKYVSACHIVQPFNQVAKGTILQQCRNQLALILDGPLDEKRSDWLNVQEWFSLTRVH